VVFVNPKDLAFGWTDIVLLKKDRQQATGNRAPGVTAVVRTISGCGYACRQSTTIHVE
jgi:hypothetical protein